MRKALVFILSLSMVLAGGLFKEPEVRKNKIDLDAVEEYMDGIFFGLGNSMDTVSESEGDYDEENKKKIEALKIKINEIKEDMEELKAKIQGVEEGIESLGYHGYGGIPRTLAVYKVIDRRIEIVDGYQLLKNDSNKYEMIWRNINQIIPDEYISYIEEFEVVSDGEGGIMGQTYSLDRKNSKWVIAIDVEDVFKSFGRFNLDELDSTIIHELAHVISLNEMQLDRNTVFPDTFKVEEGYMKEESYLNLFYQEFWTDIYKESVEAAKKDEKDGGYEAQMSFYERYEDEFVSTYASTNPEEDFAETFIEFVKRDRPEEADSIENRKILFMYGYEELAKIRDYIRLNT